MQVELERYRVSGQLSPQMEQAFQQSQTGLKGMAVDSTGRAAETAALAKMQEIAGHGGLDAQAQQQIQQATNQTNANEQGQRGAIVQNAAARGMGAGGGAMLAAELQASQGDANQAAAAGQTAAAGAQQRALQALQDSSTAGHALHSSDYGEAAAAAQAQDAINRFNTQNSQTVANTNTSTTNAAQAANLANAQSVANANTGVANQEETHNKALPQQVFQDEAQKAGGVAGAYGSQATQANTDAKNTANQWSGVGQAISGAGGAIGQAYNNKAATPGNTNPTDPAPGGYAEGGEVKKEEPDDFEHMLALSRRLKLASC